jgi:hypothetical protein
MICLERLRLSEEYAQRLAEWIKVMRSVVAEPDNTLFLRGLVHTEPARTHFQAARAALQRHEASHGCAWHVRMGEDDSGGCLGVASSDEAEVDVLCAWTVARLEQERDGKMSTRFGHA